MEDWELESAKEDARNMKREYERLQRGAALLATDELQKASNDAYAQGIKEALKEAGIPESEWNKIYFGNASIVPAVSKTIGKKCGEKFVKKAVAKAGVTRDPKTGQYVKAQPGEQAAALQGRQSLTAIAEARKAGKLDSNQALDAMISATLGDYFDNSAGVKK